MLPAATAARWVGASVEDPKAEDAVAAMARRTGDSTRDLPAPTLELVRRAFPDLDLEAEPTEISPPWARVFGEELPAGLVFHE